MVVRHGASEPAGYGHWRAASFAGHHLVMLGVELVGLNPEHVGVLLGLVLEHARVPWTARGRLSWRSIVTIAPGRVNVLL
jgi:hypothetical protein